MPPPSLKKLGKRPALNEVDGLEARETNTLAQSPTVTPAHQKRVLPSRSRRGGPGIGNCSVDLLIMDTERRARDSKPVIPPSQAFLLTTYSKAVPPPPETSAPDGEAAGSYFDKPEVKAAYLAARAIQVPEFSPLPDDAVGGRLRARAEEEGPETSDDAYLSRHRKYETFEKRQRRREKEKLVHERYKLKERIEQLKGMDIVAFGVGGEARRKDMLDVAEDLEMRYAVLLPPEPRRNIKKDDKSKKDDGPRVDTMDTMTGEDVDERTDEGDVEESPVTDILHPTPVRLVKERRTSVRAEPELPVTTRIPAVSMAVSSESPQSPQHTYIEPSTPIPRGSTRVRDSSGRFLLVKSTETKPNPSQPSSEPPTIPLNTSALPPPPPRKRQRIEKPPNLQEANPSATSVLLQIAARKAAQPMARQTSRTTLAFGFRVPPEVEEQLFFALPDWLVTQEELERIHKMRAQSTTRSPSPTSTKPMLNGILASNRGNAREYEFSTNVETQQSVENPEIVEMSQDARLPDPPVNGIEEDMTGGPVLPTSSLRELTEHQDIVMNAT